MHIGLTKRALLQRQYWCTFLDGTQQKIATLASDSPGCTPPMGAVMLPGADARVAALLDPPLGQAVQRLKVASVEELVEVAAACGSISPEPVFRGQGNYDWPLATPLERNVSQHRKEALGLERYEHRVLVESQRRLHQHLTPLPDLQDHFSWTAMLRHHGVPTRLLDVTKSFFVACYFAVSDALDGTDGAVWIVFPHAMHEGFSEWMHRAEPSWIRPAPWQANHDDGSGYTYPAQSGSRYSSAAPTSESLGIGGPRLGLLPSAILDAALRGYVEQPGVALAEPHWLSKRMDAQQGTFLVPFNASLSFERNLSSFLDLDCTTGTEELSARNVLRSFNEWWFDVKVAKVRVPRHLRGELRHRLKDMNVRDLTLFPDIDGALWHVGSFVPIESSAKA